MAYKKISIISILLVSCYLSGCAFFTDAVLSKREPTEREQMFAEAETFYKNNDFDSAKHLYFRLSRNIEGATDPIYDQSLWRLVKIYEKEDHSEKALLTLDELLTRKSSILDKYKIKFSQIKNNYRVTNFYRAHEIKKEVDEAYNKESLYLDDLYNYLIDTTTLSYDHRPREELMYLGEVQKFFVFIMESPMEPEREQITEQLINNYEHFFSLLKKDQLSDELKKKLSVSLLDQLRKFNQYHLGNGNAESKTISRFLAYSEKQQKILIERFRQ